MEYETFLNDSYNLYTIKTNKFKNAHIEIIFRNKCTKENISYNALLFDVLMENNKEYPSRKLLTRHAQELYNTCIYSSTSRVGDTLITNVISEFLDPKYMDKDSLESIIKLTFDMIFNPNINIDEFDENTINKAKKRLINEIESIKEYPKQDSILKALKELDANAPYSLNTTGSIDLINFITPKKLYKYYKDYIENAIVDIYVIGNLDMKEINKLVQKYSKFTSIKTNTTNLYLDDIKANKCIKKNEKSSITQTQLVEIYKVSDLDEFETNYVMQLWNMIWGSASLDSKLYKCVRGNNSLCYNISSFYQKYDKLIIVHTALDKENTTKAEKLIKETFNEMLKGNITLEELENAKSILVNSLNLIYDLPSRLIDNYLFRNIAGLKDIEERIDEFNRITVDDLKRVSKKIKLIEVYRMGA